MKYLDELKKNFVNNILILFTIIIVVTYPTGPFLPDFFLSLSGLIFLFQMIRKKTISYFYNIYSIFFLVFFVYIILNSIFSSLPKVSLLSSGFYFRFYLFSLIVWYLFEYEEKFKILLYRTLLITILFINLDTIFQYFYGFDFFGYESLNHRLTGPFGDELIVGSYLSKTIPVLISLGYYINKKNYNLLFGLLTLSVMTTFLSGERAAFFMITIFYMFFILISVNKKSIKKILLSLFIVIITILTILISDKSRFDRMVVYPVCAMNIDYFSLFGCKIKDVPTSSDSDIFKRPVLFSEAHEGHFKAAFKMFLDEPIFGKGIKMFRYHCNEYKFWNPHSCTTHPHNLLLQILAELGLVGLIFLSVILYKIYKTFIVNLLNRRKINEHIRVSFLLINFLLIQLFFIILPSGSIFNNYLSILYFLPLGIYFSLEKKIN